MSISKLAGLVAAVLFTLASWGASAQASCRDASTCSTPMVKKQVRAHKKVSHRAVSKRVYRKVAATSSRRHAKRVAQARLSSKRVRSSSAMLVAAPRGRAPVVALIKSMAPRYGVPTWFALRIAQIESGYNPRARGAAGEYGVFQLKCATARGIGFRGGCGQLLNASTNVQYGLKHLSLAVRSSRGNLRLAASKHNGGLGRKRLVPSYVNRVF